VNDDVDNTPIMGPAGAVHMTLGSLCKYATEHLRGELGAGKLLAAETYKQLHTPELDDYACGWVVKQPTYEIPRTTYWHNGSNTMWYALVVFIRNTDPRRCRDDESKPPGHTSGGSLNNAPVAELARAPTNADCALNSGEFNYKW
jgi:hypothetical protein